MTNQTREELKQQYLEAKKRGDKIMMARIVAKAYGLGYRKSVKKPIEKNSFIQQVQQALT